MRRIPATIVTGFLGAGKTSLVRHLLRDRRRPGWRSSSTSSASSASTASCCSAAASDLRRDDIVELANGCLCCTVADDFLPTLTGCSIAPTPPGHIVVETSGLALPKPLIQAFAWPRSAPA